MADNQGDKRNTNLARIRDNQRRSRARRKDYLAELETKYRQCEQTGVEATAEIQSAARKVVDENKRLRQLLKQQGLSDAQIDGTASEVRDTDIANELESKLGTRKPCKPGGCCGVSASVYEAQSGSSVSPAMSTHEQQPQIFPIEPLPTSASLSSTNYHYPPIAGTYPLHPATADYPFDFAASFDWQDPLQHPNPTNVPPLSESVPSTSSSSCQVAASAVRLMRPDLGPELEEELCCGTGEDCTVSNDCIFSIMDRYSNGT